MIEYIHGDLTELTPAMAVVETAGVGYGLNISLNTYTAIQGKQEVKLYVHEVLVAGGRDDSFTLFGFASKQERELYRQLITVSGVRQYGENDSLVDVAKRTLQCDFYRQRQDAEDREGYRIEDRPAHHHRPEG